MARLSSPLSEMKPHYTAVVVGSGYGGGVAASRLARAGQQVCLLERGREFRPGDYPNTVGEAEREMQLETPDGRIGSQLGLFDFHVNHDINALVGCGLGGTSLINANVSLRAVPGVFADPRWPEAVRRDLPTRVERGYQLAEQMLKPNPYPQTYPELPKLDALAASAAALGKANHFYRPPINVTFADGMNHVGVEQKACNGCGDCVSGCNNWAKNTTLMNYLPDAWNHGAEIYTQVHVRWVERRAIDGRDRWVVHYQLVGEGRGKFDAPELFVTADIVVLSAGTLGSTEILLRSKAKGLPLSDALGTRFTGNGDVLAFGYNGDRAINGVGFGHRSAAKIAEQGPVGPCITGIVDLRDTPNVDDGFVIEEGSIPGAIAPILPGGFAGAEALQHDDEEDGLIDRAREKARELASFLRGAYHGAVHNTQTYLVMSHDGSNGRMVLEKDRLRIHWPGVGKEPIFQTVNDTLDRATKPLGGSYVPDPLWGKLFDQSLVTVHPLGGCPMADTGATGAVDPQCRVFQGSGDAVHEGLYVADGAVMPRSLGVNPLFTITAMAERTLALLTEERGWTIDYTLPSRPRAEPPPPKIGVRFTETMKGYFSTEVKDDFVKAEKQGKAANSPMEFTLTIQSDDLDDMLANPKHEAHMAGTVVAPVLSPEPLVVSNGVFNLFVDNPAQVDTRNMIYRMRLTSEEGKTFFFHGEKIVTDSPITASWPQTTTLYVTVYDGQDQAAPVLGTGVLHIAPADFLKQMTTMTATNAPSEKARLEALVRFGKFFAGTLFEAYGGVFAPEKYFNPDAAPRKKRPLKAGAPEIHDFVTSDGVRLRLTRYRGGSKGPLLMVHGAGVSSGIFSTDLIDTNMLEYLYGNGYDCWLFDFRVSIALEASKAQSNGDQIASIDHPEAVAYVLKATGAASLQAMVHCYGSNTFFMAMLAGLKGVRSIVCSQIATNLKTATLTRVKSMIHTPEILEALGVKSLTAYTSTHSNWRQKLIDDALRLYPVGKDEACRNPVCHRITFLYALLYEHQQLDEFVHDNIHELFGAGNITTFEHLALMVRREEVVSATGANVYLPHLDRLALPIRFLHGAENACYLPVSTEITLDLLSKANGAKYYDRHVIPGYGHIDCIFGKNAVRDVYPLVLEHLEATL